MPLFTVQTYDILIQQQPGFLRDYPKYNEWLEKVSLLSEDNQETVNEIVDAMAIDNATGDILNKLGEIVGIQRSQIILDSGDAATDAQYRKVIRGKIAQNYWDGTFEGFVEILNTVFAGSLTFSLIDNQDMSVSVFVQGLVDATDLELLVKGYYTPKAMGVGIGYNLSEIIDEEFSFEESLTIKQRINAFPQNNNPIVDVAILINGEFYSG